MAKYEFITPLEERPKVAKKPKVSVAEQIIREFEESNVKYAVIKPERISGVYKNNATCARVIGRMLRKLGLDRRIRVYSTSEGVFLERL